MTDPTAIDPKITDRIRKLLRLSKSAANEHEAALAAARAAELMEEHQLEEAQLRLDEGRDAEPITKATLTDHKRVVAWQGTIAGALGKSMRCRQWWSPSGKIQILGRPSDIAAVTYTFTYLVGEIDRLADENWARVLANVSAFSGGVPSARAWKSAFRIGAAYAVSERLHADRAKTHEARVAHAQEAGATSRALMVVEREEAEVEVAYKDMAKKGKFTSFYSSAGSSSSSGFAAGQSVGRRIQISGGKGLRSGAAKLKGR